MVRAAGLLLFRRQPLVHGQENDGTAGYEVLLVHPGGPFWAKKDEWSIPKGEVDAGETLLQTMRREFIEEMGTPPPIGKSDDRRELISLGNSKQRTGKINHIWAVEADFDLTSFHCDSMVVMQWPPNSGKTIEFPENDKAEWFDLQVAYHKIFRTQQIFIERLADHLGIELKSPLTN